MRWWIAEAKSKQLQRGDLVSFDVQRDVEERVAVGQPCWHAAENEGRGVRDRKSVHDHLASGSIHDPDQRLFAAAFQDRVRHQLLVRRERQAAQLDRSAVRELIQIQQRFDRFAPGTVKDLYRGEFLPRQDAAGAREIATADPETVVIRRKYESLSGIHGSLERVTQRLPSRPRANVLTRRSVLRRLPRERFLGRGFEPLIRVVVCDPTNCVCLGAHGSTGKSGLHTQIAKKTRRLRRRVSPDFALTLSSCACCRKRRAG